MYGKSFRTESIKSINKIQTHWFIFFFVFHLWNFFI
jgi:hypothetical protein